MCANPVEVTNMDEILGNGGCAGSGVEEKLDDSIECLWLAMVRSCKVIWRNKHMQSQAGGE